MGNSQSINDQINNGINEGVNQLKNKTNDVIRDAETQFNNKITNGVNDGVSKLTLSMNSINKELENTVNSSKSSILKTVGDIRADLTSFNTYEITQLKNSFAGDIYSMKNQLAKDFKLSTTAMIDYSNNEINKVKGSLVTTVQDTEKNIINLKNNAIGDTQTQINNTDTNK